MYDVAVKKLKVLQFRCDAVINISLIQNTNILKVSGCFLLLCDVTYNPLLMHDLFIHLT